LERDKPAIWFGDIRLAAKGDDITIRVELGRGEATVWTCDLTKAYVEIKGD